MTYSATGSEFLVNATTTGNQFPEDIFALPGGKFAVRFHDASDPFKQGDKLIVLNAAQPDIGGVEVSLAADGPTAVLSDGRAVVVHTNSDFTAISAQFLTGNLTADGSDIALIIDPTGGYFNLISPSVAPLADGGFAVVLAGRLLGTSSSTIFLQTFDAAGKFLAEAVNVGDGDINGTSSLAVLSDGRIAVLNVATHAVSVFPANLVGTPQVTIVDTAVPETETMGEAKIVALQQGTFALIWDENQNSGGSVNIGPIHAQVFGADGKPLSDDIIIDPHGPARVNSIDVAALTSGGFAVAWSSRISDTDTDILVKTFSATGQEVGTAQAANTTRGGNQSGPHITGLAGGGFVVGWDDLSQTAPDTSGEAVRAQVFASNAGQVLTGTKGADTLTGTTKDDTLIGLAGDDMLDGKAGNDTASYAAAGAAVSVSLASAAAQDTGGAGKDTLHRIENLEGSRFADTLRGNAGNNVLSGGGGNDRLLGGDGADRIEGGAGADVLDGGKGADTMIGGTGNDLYYINNVGDAVFESHAKADGTGTPLGGTDKVITTIDYALPASVEQLFLAKGAGAIRGTGNNAANVIVGNESDNFIFGGGGADRLTGRLGADTFKLNPLGTGIPIITDFAPGTDHLLIASNPYFAFQGREGQTLANADLALGSKATTANQHLIYYAKTGTLFYDADGAGGQTQVKIAVLLGHPDLHASDIGVIAI